MQSLIFSTKDDSIRKLDCLTDVYNNQHPDWEMVVRVVGNFPIINSLEACKIAKKYMSMEEAECQCIISTHESSKEDVKGNKTGIESVGKHVL